MGRVEFPADGSVYLDTPIIVYGVETHPRYFPIVEPLWDRIVAGAVRAHTSELTILECLVKPIRDNNGELIKAFHAAFRHPSLTLHPVNLDILEAAAALRAAHPSLKTPDAIHLATGAEVKCEYFVTNDGKLTNLRAMPSIVIDEMSG